MTIDDWLKLAVPHLRDAGIDSARLDALILLEDTLQLDKSYLLAHPEADIAPQHLLMLAEQLERRDQHEPLAYIRGFCEFYGRRFIVNSDVLVPRPESESIIELLKKHLPSNAVIADIGAGSGCLAITAALETGATVYAVDVDEACLDVTRQNAIELKAVVTCLVGSLMEPLASVGPNVILANLPYVPDDYSINDAAKHEPALALFAGADGLDLYRQLFARLPGVGLVITESLLEQHLSLAEIAQVHGFKLAETDGLAQVFLAV